MPDTKFHFERFEFKYLLTPPQARELERDLLGSHLTYDPFVVDSPELGYWISSLYFDGPDWFCYHDKISGIRNRFKIRLRTYSPDIANAPTGFLEIKRKNDAVIIKDRLILNNHLAGLDFNLTNLMNYKNFHGGQESVWEEIAYKLSKYVMRPNIISKYFRRPLVGKLNNKLRITFDEQIQSGSFHGLENPISTNVINTNLVVMEIKYNNTLPDWLHRTIMRHNLIRSPFSKYCEGIEYLARHHYC